MTALEILIDAAHVPLSCWRARYPEYRAMGVLCSYVPEEMLDAAGFTPVRVRGTSAPLRHVDAHMQSFTCALCRSALDQALAGDLGGLAGTVFAHTCDAMQALADLWRMNRAETHFMDVVMQPVNLGSRAARAYLVAELRRFRERLGAYADRPIDDEVLRASIGLYDETRRLVQALAIQRGRLTAPDFFAVLDAAQAMPRRLFNPTLATLLEELADTPSGTSGPRLFLTGAILDEPQVPELIEELGAQVVGDDLCSGSRHFFGQVGTGGDPIVDLADYFLRRPPCPTKLNPLHDASRHLLDQVRETQAGGIVFLVEKYCEPHAFERALLRPVLERAGVPCLVLEMEQTPSLEGLRTRLQAFVEML
jgi:benzoyl-CoA reductase/2-hydroxyglutaryl-CoA dehydratase subunit BcrC/BadD/HgdB